MTQALLLLVGVLAQQHQWNSVFITGQSLSTGVSGTPALTTSLSNPNLLMLSGGTGGDMTTQINLPAISLRESLPAATPRETGHAALGLQLLAMGPGSRWFVNRHGEGGRSYVQVRKGTTNYNYYLNFQLPNLATFASSQAVPQFARFVVITHGEADFNADLTDGPTYLGYLQQWRSDFDADAKARNGAAQPDLVVSLDQMSTWTYYSRATPVHTPSGNYGVPLAQWAAARDYPEQFQMATAKYFLPYSDGVHLTRVGYQMLGEYHAQALHRRLGGWNWVPLAPRRITRSGATITVRLFNPTGTALVNDTTTVGARPNMGFEFWDNSGATPAISSVTLDQPNQITIQLASAPTGSEQRLRYAFTGTAGANGGSAGAARGNVRDASAIVGATSAAALRNWLVSFDEPIGFTWNPFAAPMRFAVDAVSANAAVVSYRAPGGAACQWRLSAQSDFSSTLQSGADDASRQRRQVSFAGLMPGTQYFVDAQCGFAEGQFSFTTAAQNSSAASYAVALTPPAYLGAAQLLLEYGSTASVALSTTAACASGCVVPVPVTAGQPLFFRSTWRTAGGVALSPPSTVQVVIP